MKGWRFFILVCLVSGSFDQCRAQDPVGAEAGTIQRIESSGPIVMSDEIKPAGAKSVHQCKPGPWGDLEYYYTYLEAPDHIMELVNTPSAKTVWCLPNRTPNQLRAFLVESGVPAKDVEAILEESIPYQLGPNYRLFPKAHIVAALTPESRQKIYAELRRYPENSSFRSPVIIEGEIGDWLKGSDLLPSTIASIEKYVYRLGSSFAFSDTPAVLSEIQNDHEDRALLKALTRTRSLILRLKISPESDFNALKDYWTSGYKRKDVLPFFEAIALTRGVDKVDVSHLLPPTPRKYLYTFPTFSLGLDGIYPDSFWTSLNFFNFMPDNQFKNEDSVLAYAQANFVKATAPYGFGDLIIVINPLTGRPQHACVFIADDIVYTKNGRSLLRPFMLMKMNDLIARYATESAPQLQVWRKIER